MIGSREFGKGNVLDGGTGWMGEWAVVRVLWAEKHEV